MIPGEYYFCVSSIKVEKGEARHPLCWTDVYALNASTRSIPQAREHSGELIASLIGKVFANSIESVDQEMSPVQLTPKLDATLKSPHGDMGLNIIRQYRNQNGEIISVSETIYPRDRLKLVMQMTRSKI